jgi:hypothetical protein
MGRLTMITTIARGAQVTGIGYDGKRWLLIDGHTQQSVARGQQVENHRAEWARIDGGTPPHGPGSTGRVRTAAGEYYPSVYGLQWVRL